VDFHDLCPSPSTAPVIISRKRYVSSMWHVWGKEEVLTGLFLFLLLKALQLQRSFGLPNEFFPLGAVFDAVIRICYFHFCYVSFYIILPPIF
jgi:hypothetical protein